MKINIIYRPTVTIAHTSSIVTSTELDEQTDDYLVLNETPDLDLVPEVAGRLCYSSFESPRPGGNQTYIKRILSEGHGSVLQHSNVGLLITGVSRSLTHELIRHGTGTAFSELSQRYYEPDTCSFVLPPLWIDDLTMEAIFTQDCVKAARHYKFAIEQSDKVADGIDPDLPPRDKATLKRKRSREAARASLPNCTETKILVTANLRAWRNMIEQRANWHADLEIRRLFCVIYETLADMAPNCFQDMELFTDIDGKYSVRSEHRKV